MSCCGVSKCPDTHPDILCKLCDLWYPYGGSACKHNYHPSDINWAQFGREAEALCKGLGLDYYIKESLRAEMEKA